jgi:hypothetical protein
LRGGDEGEGEEYLLSPFGKGGVRGIFNDKKCAREGLNLGSD